MRSAKAIMAPTLALLLAMSVQALGAPAYPGGQLFLRYELRYPDKHPASLTFEVIPGEGGYEVRMGVAQFVPRDEAEGRNPLELIAFTPELDVNEAGFIMPLFSIWGRGIEPNKEYRLRNRARLITGDRDDVLGIPVIRARYLNPGFPDLVAYVAIPDLSHRGLLPAFLPPYLRVEEKTDKGYRLVYEIVLVEFRHEG